MQTIVTLTMNPALDVSCRTESIAPEKKLACRDVTYEPGGGGVNVSRAIRKLGGGSLAMYPAGGTAGERLKGLLDEEGVEQEPMRIEGWTRQNLIVKEQSSEQQYRFGMPGAELTESEWQDCLDRVASARDIDYLVASGSLPPGVPDDFLARLACTARRRGIRFVVDTRGEPLRLAAKEGVFLLKPNLRELGQLADTEIESEEQQVSIAEDLLQSGGCEVLVLSLGPAGALLVADGIRERVRSPSVSIRSKVGAGDSMLAGLVLGLAEEMSVRDAVLRGVAAGAAAVMTPGTELCRRSDAERLFESLRADPSGAKPEERTGSA